MNELTANFSWHNFALANNSLILAFKFLFYDILISYMINCILIRLGSTAKMLCLTVADNNKSGNDICNYNISVITI